MGNADEPDIPVNAKAVLIDPASMTVVWMNESALQEVPGEDGESVRGLPVAQAVPMAELLGVPEALRRVSDTGVVQHLHTNLVSTAKGIMEIVSSVYPLPDGKLLLLTEHAWQAKHGTTDASESRRPRRR